MAAAEAAVAADEKSAATITSQSTTAAESGSEEAEAAKSRGNVALKAGAFTEAIDHYTAAIALDGYNHVYYSNRSAAYLSLGDTTNAIADARACILMKKDWSKGYSRLGAALHKAGEFEEAVRAYADGLRIDPSNRLIMDGMVAAQKGVTGQLEAKILQESAGAPLNVPSSGAITIGADVEVFGLKGAPEHNGKTGKVTSFDVRRYAPTLVQQQGSISSIHTYRRLLL